jgi:hypothetical protein
MSLNTNLSVKKRFYVRWPFLSFLFHLSCIFLKSSSVNWYPLWKILKLTNANTIWIIKYKKKTLLHKLGIFDGTFSLKKVWRYLIVRSHLRLGHKKRPWVIKKKWRQLFCPIFVNAIEYLESTPLDEKKVRRKDFENCYCNTDVVF